MFSISCFWVDIFTSHLPKTDCMAWRVELSLNLVLSRKKTLNFWRRPLPPPSSASIDAAVRALLICSLSSPLSQMTSCESAQPAFSSREKNLQIIPKMLYTRAVQLPHHHQAATLLFATVWVPWQLRGCCAEQLKSSGGYTQLDVPTLCSRERRNSKQNFYNKYHTASSSLCDSQWFVKGTKRTRKPTKCIKVREQTTEKTFSHSSPLMA